MVRPAGCNHLVVHVHHAPSKGKRKPNAKGVCREAESEGRRRQNIPPMNKNHIQGSTMEIKRPYSLKSDTCPESRDVDVAVINGEVTAQYPGRAANPLRKKQPEPRGEGQGTQQSAEGRVAATPRREGPL